jgi:hypothetical protein
LAANAKFIHSFSEFATGDGTLSDAVVHLLSYIPRLNLRALGIWGRLNQYTLDAFSKALEEQDFLRFFTLPSYRKMPFQYDVVSPSEPLMKDTQELHDSLAFRRRRITTSNSVQNLDAGQLMDGLDMYTRLERNHDHPSSSMYRPIFHALAANGAPKSLVKEHITNRADSSKVLSVTMMSVRTVSGRPYSFPRKQPWLLRLDIPELNLSEMFMLHASKNISKVFSVKKMEGLALHNCYFTAPFIDALATYSKAHEGELNLKSFLYWHRRYDSTNESYEKLLSAMNTFLKSFSGLRHIHLEYPAIRNPPVSEANSASVSGSSSQTVASSDASWEVASWAKNHPDLETISLNFAHFRICHPDMKALASLYMLRGIGTQFQALAQFLCDGNVKHLRESAAEVAVSIP